MWTLRGRSICHIFTSGVTPTPTCLAWFRFASSHSVSSLLSLQSLSSNKTCPIPFIHHTILRRGTHHNQATRLSPLDIHHNSPGTLHIPHLATHPPPVDIHLLTLGTRPEEEGQGTHHIPPLPSQEEPDQEQELSLRITSMRASSPQWRIR